VLATADGQIENEGWRCVMMAHLLGKGSDYSITKKGNLLGFPK